MMENLLKATDALARYDQMLKNMHNNEILLAPLRNQEAVISSRMEGTVSTMDEIMQYEADYGDGSHSGEVRSDIVETLLYQRALKNAQNALADGYGLWGRYYFDTFRKKAKEGENFKGNRNLNGNLGKSGFDTFRCKVGRK